MQVTVQRGPADQHKQGPDITSSLLTGEQVAVARGRHEIDYNCSDRELVTCTGPLLEHVPPGSLARIIEAYGPRMGYVRLWAMTLTIDEEGRRFTASTTLRVEVEI